MRFLGQVVDVTGELNLTPTRFMLSSRWNPPQVFQNCADFWVWSTRWPSFHHRWLTKPSLSEIFFAKESVVLGQLSRKSVPRGEKSSKLQWSVGQVYEVSREAVVSADTSSYSLGLGAVLHQKQLNGELQPVAYISRALTHADRAALRPAEKRGSWNYMGL